jgi:hypothetical protein
VRSRIGKKESNGVGLRKFLHGLRFTFCRNRDVEMLQNEMLTQGDEYFCKAVGSVEQVGAVSP